MQLTEFLNQVYKTYEPIKKLECNRTLRSSKADQFNVLETSCNNLQ